MEQPSSSSYIDFGSFNNNKIFTYYELKKLLESKSSCDLLLAYEKPDGGYLYLGFNQHLDFMSWLYKNQKVGSFFHEIVRPDSHQKLRFDIDIKKSECDSFDRSFFNTVVEEIIEKIIELDLGFNINDLLLLTSHNDNKLSGHLILTKHYVLNSNHAKHL